MLSILCHQLLFGCPAYEFENELAASEKHRHACPMPTTYKMIHKNYSFLDQHSEGKKLMKIVRESCPHQIFCVTYEIQLINHYYQANRFQL